MARMRETRSVTTRWYGRLATIACFWGLTLPPLLTVSDLTAELRQVLALCIIGASVVWICWACPLLGAKDKDLLSCGSQLRWELRSLPWVPGCVLLAASLLLVGVNLGLRDKVATLPFDWKIVWLIGVIAAGAVLIGWQVDQHILRRLRRRLLQHLPYCLGCGYDLRGCAARPHCPECGKATDPDATLTRPELIRTDPLKLDRIPTRPRC